MQKDATGIDQRRCIPDVPLSQATPDPSMPEQMPCRVLIGV